MRSTVLMSATVLGLAAAALGGGVVRAQEAAVEPSVLGDTSRDLLFTPVVPCRIVDTRVAGGPISSGATRDFKVTGDAHQAQGGSIAGCGVPSGPTSAVLNIVAIDATAAGHLRAWAYSTPPVGPPLAAVLTFASGLNITNGLPVPLCDPTATSCGFDVRIFAAVGAAGSVDLVIDVVGYFSGRSVSDADVAPGAAIAESKLALNFPTHSAANDPSAAEKAGLAGTSGVPGAANRYVTNSDPRNADARVPLVHGVGAHNSTVISLTGDYGASRFNTSGTSATAMLSVDGRSMCFFTYISFQDTDDSSESAACRIRELDGVWTLEAVLGFGLFGIDADVSCAARCIQW